MGGAEGLGPSPDCVYSLQPPTPGGGLGMLQDRDSFIDWLYTFLGGDGD